jgi:hypothetical protein
MGLELFSLSRRNIIHGYEVPILQIHYKISLSSSHETESVLFSGHEKKCQRHFLPEESSFTIFWVQ